MATALSCFCLSLESLHYVVSERGLHLWPHYFKNWELETYSSMIEHLPCRYEVLGSISRTSQLKQITRTLRLEEPFFKATSRDKKSRDLGKWGLGRVTYTVCCKGQTKIWSLFYPEHKGDAPFQRRGLRASPSNGYSMVHNLESHGKRADLMYD